MPSSPVRVGSTMRFPNDNRAFPSLAGSPKPRWPYIRRSRQLHDCFLYVASGISSWAFFRSRLAADTLA